jgi:outer membrane protein, heavy metal efflux system
MCFVHAFWGKILMFFRIPIWAGVVCLFVISLPVHADPLSRLTAIQVAIEHNPEIAAAHAIWKAEQARALQTWALPQPELELEYEGLLGVFDFGHYEQRNIGLTQHLSFPVKWWQRHREAAFKADAVRLSVYETTRLNIVGDVQMAYDRVLADQRLLHLTEEHVQLSKDFLDRAQKRFGLGDVPKLDVMRAEVALNRLENKLTMAQNAVLRSQSMLNTLLGLAPNASLVLTDSLDGEPETFVLEELYAQALRQRSDLRAAHQVLASAQAARTASFVSFVPDISFSLARQTTNSTTGYSNFWRTGFVLKLPIWAMFEQRGEIAEASAQHAMAEAEIERTKLNVMQQVQTTYLTFQATTKRMVWMQERIRPTTEAAYHMARRSYDEGKATYLDLLEAQKDLIETGMEYVETLFEYHSARTQLLNAIGQSPVSPR